MLGVGCRVQREGGLRPEQTSEPLSTSMVSSVTNNNGDVDCFSVQGSGFRGESIVQGAGCRVQGVGLRVEGFRVWPLRSRTYERTGAPRS